MEVEAESSSSSSTVAIGELVAALEQATLMAKHLSTTADPSHLLQIRAALNSAHHHLSLFLSHQSAPPENSVSSAVGGGGGEERMQMGDDDDEHNSRAAAANVDKVEERMRECFIQNKRAKRRLSPAAAAAELRRGDGDEAVRGGAAAAEFDPIGTKLKSLDLIYQFHA